MLYHAVGIIVLDELGKIFTLVFPFNYHTNPTILIALTIHLKDYEKLNSIQN